MEERVIETIHFGGTTIRFVDTSWRSTWPPMIRMEIYGDTYYHVELATEQMTQLRHALRMACRITRAREQCYPHRGGP